MRLFLALSLIGSAASAAEIPDSWRCDAKKEARYWAGLQHVDQKKGPSWGQELYERLPTPFAWLVLYKNRDRDIAERRAPITRRWGEFEPFEKCAYFNHYSDEIHEKHREFEELVNWKQDGKLEKRLARLVDDKEDLVSAQEGPLLKRWRTRFATMLDWLELYGLEDEAGTLERARGIFIRIGRLKTAYLAFQQESGWFESRVRKRLGESLADAGFKDRLKREFRADGAMLALLDAPSGRERIVSDVAEALSKDWRNDRILGDGFEGRVAVLLRVMKRERKQAAHTAQVKEVRRKIREKKLSRRKAKRLVDGIEKDLRAEKILFPAGADAELLISLEEYRRGRTKLYPMAEEGTPREELVKAYLNLLKDVCVMHYTSIRYKKRVIKTLCGS
jgi:hypothetical protein